MVKKMTQNDNFGRRATSEFFRFLMWMTKYALWDNHVTRGLEKKFANMSVGKNSTGGDKKFSSFVKRNPNLSGHVLYYTMLAMLAYGADRVHDDEHDGAVNSTEITTDAHAVPSTQPKIMTDADVKKMLDTHWYEIAVGLTELETYRATPVVHRGERRPTNGLGVTWTYRRGADGRITQTANNSKTPARTFDQNYEQVRMHLEFETLPKLARIARDTNVDERMAVALIYAGYQRLSDMSGIAQRASTAQTPQQVADAFQYFHNMPKKYKYGSLKRRWVCAAYAVGAITADDLLKMSRDAFSALEVNNIYRNGHFLLGAETVKFVLSRTNKNESVETFLAGFPAGQKILGGKQQKVFEPFFNLAMDVVADAGIEKSMRSLNGGEQLMRQKKYADAVRAFQQAIDQDPDNMQAYSDLAFAYKKLGDQNKSVDYYEKAAATVVQCNRRMNANKSLLFDYTVKATSYYNAGTAREEMAKIYMAGSQKKLARENYAKALKNYQNALYNCQQADDNNPAVRIYNDAIERVQLAMEKNSNVAPRATSRPQTKPKGKRPGKTKRNAFSTAVRQVLDNGAPDITIQDIINLTGGRDMR